MSVEACDDGDTANLDGCNQNCFVESGWTCTGSPSVCVPVCGDGLKVFGEICDDGNLINDVGCLADCSGTAPGYLCSGGSTTSPTICTEVCGNGF